MFPLETVSTPSAFSAEMLSVRHATQQWHAVPGDQLLGAPVVEPFERGAYFRLVAGALETQPLHETLYNRRMKGVLQARIAGRSSPDALVLAEGSSPEPAAAIPDCCGPSAGPKGLLPPQCLGA